MKSENLQWPHPKKLRMNCNQCEKELVQENCLICSACRQAVYCSRQCQKLNWKIHKSKCKQLRPDGNKEHSCDDCSSLNLKMNYQKLVIQCCYKKEWNSFFEGISRKTLIPLQDLKIIVQERLSQKWLQWCWWHHGIGCPQNLLHPKNLHHFCIL